MGSQIAEVSVIQQGLDLMIYGMGTVFVFLTLLVFGTMIMSKFISRFLPEEEPSLANVPASPVIPPAQQHAKAIAIIEDAIRQHRAKA